SPPQVPTPGPFRRSAGGAYSAYASSTATRWSARSRRHSPPSRRFSSTLSSLTMPWPSGTCATRRRAMDSGLRPTNSDPSSSTDPCRGLTNPGMVRTTVVLPAPLAPSTAVMAPSGTENETSLSATTPPYATVRWATSSMGHRLTEIGGGHVGVGTNFCRSPRRDDPAEVQDRDPVADGHHHVDVVLHQRDAHARAKLAQQSDQLFHLSGRQPAGWLVEQEQRWVRHERARDDDPFLHAMRQRPRIHTCAISDAELAQGRHRVSLGGLRPSIGC